MKRKKKRIALLGIYHESNTFIKQFTVYDDFENGHLLRGEEIQKEYRNAYHEIGGMLEVMDKEDVAVVPVFFAEATPGGIVQAAAYDRLTDEMFSRLREALPVDACFVVPHGAGVSEQHADMDGHWLNALRYMVGPDVPIVGTLDPHANVSEQMVNATDALIAYQTNPHIDQRETGRRAASVLVNCLNQGVRPRQVFMQPPVTISIEQQYTAAYPCTLLYSLAAMLRNDKKLLAISILLGFPYADVPEMGTSFLIVTDDAIDKGQYAAHLLAKALLNNHWKFAGAKQTIEDQLTTILEAEKPVLLLDMGDNVGGGSMGNSVFLLKALEAHSRFRSFIAVFAPEAVSVAVGHRIGNTFVLAFGSDNGFADGKPYESRVTLLAVADGKFTEKTPRHGGQVRYDMGKTVILKTAVGNTVMLHSLRVPPFSLSQLTSFGIVPAAFEAIVAKGVNAPIAAYGPVCPTILQINTPGVTQADMTRFTYKNRRRPLFPFENPDGHE